MKYKGSELEALVEGSASSLFYAGTIQAAYSIPGLNGAQVTVSDAFRTKYRIGEDKELFYIVDERMTSVGDSNVLYIYPADFEGCYFVMGDFEGNDAIFSLGATKGDWVVVQGREWVKIITTQREIAGISGEVTTEALATKLSTPTPTNTNPLAKQSSLKDFVRKDEAVDFATDLTGVVEATPEMFTYRPSAGDKSVRDESAVIRKIKGNTSVWGQLADITDSIINSGNGYILERSKDRMSFSITRVGSSATSFWCSLNMKAAYRVIGHKYLFVADAEASNIASNSDYVSVTNYNLTTPNHNFNLRENRRALYSCISTPDEKSTGWQFAFYAYGKAKLTVYNLQCFDLTDIFGAGNEPTTYEEFREYYPDAYYPYCPPEVRSMRATGIETVGFNAFNGEYAEVIGGQTYYLGVTIDTAHFATEIGGELEEITIPENRLYTPPTNGYIYATGTDICINLSHSGVRNGEYKPYEKNTLLLPEIAKYFPNGMHGIGDVCDEINEEMAIQRFGVVDLGTLMWISNGTSSSTGGLRSWITSSIKSVFPTGANSYDKSPNMVCLKYPTGSNNSTYRGELSIACGVDGSIFLFDPEYTSDADKDAFIASLQGVLLYYELAEPIYTPIDEPLQLAYKVDDFGTEKMLSDAPSSPFKADIVYQFNAEGRIRDNSRNIERLEEQLQSAKEEIQNAGVQSDWLEDNPDSKAFIKNKPTMPTQVATASEVITTMSNPSSMLPNVVYIVFAGLERFTLPALVDGDANAYNVWKIIFIPPAASNLTFPDNLVWKDGVAPNWTEAGGYCELTFTKFANSWLLGEWKLYK